MATLDRIIELQSSGFSQDQIVQQLQNEGISPKEINESLNQANVKNAISPMEPANAQELQAPQPGEPQPPADPQGQEPQQGEVQQQGVQAPASPEIYPPENQEYYQQTPQAYSGQEYYPQTNAPDTETISEIVEQVVSEKLEKFQEKTGDIGQFQTTIRERVSNIDERLKRIENSIDKLQQAVIGKIGEFGESSAMVHKDLENLHGTVSKLMNPLIDNVNEMKKKSK